MRELYNIDEKIPLLDALRNLKKSASELPMKTNTILIFNLTEQTEKPDLELLTFANIKEAIEKYNFLEKELQEAADIVLVRAESADSIRNAFRNYFSDTKDFVAYVDEGLRVLGQRSLIPSFP